VTVEDLGSGSLQILLKFHIMNRLNSSGDMAANLAIFSRGVISSAILPSSYIFGWVGWSECWPPATADVAQFSGLNVTFAALA
jgi:hypothetical protein